ncbi:Peroxiredoxin-6 [Eumeta japonica]|uniref:Peroxiredoxin-6 n=1 Tax=Eumeta variegata TaxID=151549 RepID=A0A4C2A7C3_EUMVA|nr:Peroxiredoxin-6 [Eumeta japonica]
MRACVHVARACILAFARFSARMDIECIPSFHIHRPDSFIDQPRRSQSSWGILLSHPSDFTPVCTTELARVLKLMPEFKKRNVKVVGLSCDSVDNHVEWCKDIASYAGYGNSTFPYPLIEDNSRKIATTLGMIDKDASDNASDMPLTARALFVIDPNKKFRLSILYPATTGRNFEENGGKICNFHIVVTWLVATAVAVLSPASGRGSEPRCESNRCVSPVAAQLQKKDEC